MVSFKFDYFLSVFPTMLDYLFITLKLAFFSLLLGLVLGLVLAIISHYKMKILYPISKVYVSFFRSTPFIAQLFLFYYGLAQYFEIIRDMEPKTALVLALGINASAYMAETIRGAISSVDSGQYEASLSVGMTNMQAMRRIIIPQAIRVAIPSLSNNFVNLIKSTAVGFTIGVTEMMSMAQIESTNSFRYIEVYVATIIIYWVLISIFSIFQKKLECHMNKAY